ncbi:MAG: efflux RND transporter permease subunit, partial [Planctomycetota bacterium]|nr:efflux RND transporter permease subunit [Planctomycetota bacterium]
MNLVRLAVRNPVAVNIVMVAVIGVGLYSWNSLRREFFPNIDPDQVFITVAWPGATPEEVEKAIVRRIERELRDLDEVEEVRSSVLEGVAAITVVLEDDADRDRVLNDVRSAIDKVEPDLPVDSEDPEIIESRPLLPVISVVVYGTAGEGRLREVAKDVRDDLLDFPGISRITLSGLREREIWVEVIPEKLEEYGLTLEEVGSVLARSNLDLPGGQLKGERGNIRIRTLGEKERARELEMTLVRSVPDGGSIRLRDVARVRETFEDKVEHGRFQGQSAVMVTVFKTPEQDALKIASMAKDYVQKSVLPYGDEIKLATTTDLSRFIAQRLDLMLRNARLGILLVVLVLAVFLELRVALWVSVGLFISFLGGFYVMELLGASINLISLFGLIVVLGLLVDDAIVVGERIFTRRREGMKPEEAAIQGTTEVAGPVTIAVLTTIIAFLPLAFMGGRLGTMMGVLPLVVISALTVSLLDAFTILPSHLAHSTKRKGRFRERLERFGEIRHRFFEKRLPDLLEGSLRFAFRWRYVTLSAAAGLFLLVMGLVAGGVVKVVFLPRTDAETVVLDLEMAAGTPEAETMAVVEKLEALAQAAPEVKSIFSVVGTSFSDRGRQTPADPATIGQITLELVAAEDRRGSNLRHSEKLIDQLRRDARFIPGVRRLAIAARGGISGSDIEVRLRGDEMDTLRALTAELREELGSYKGVTQIQDDLAEGKMEIRFRLRDDARSLGLTTREVARQVR